MTHSWNDFADAGLGPQLPLTSGQQAQQVSGVLPSGESNFFDLEQDRQKHYGSGIDKDYDYAKEAAGSGVVATYPRDGLFSTEFTGKPSGISDFEYESGIFHFNGPSGAFSSGYYMPSGFDVRFQKYIRPSVSNYEPPRPDYAFRVMDSYIHYKGYIGTPTRYIEIKFMDDVDVALEFNRYNGYTPNQNGFYDAGYK